MSNSKDTKKNFFFEELNSNFVESVAKRIEHMVKHNMTSICFIVTDSDLSNDYLQAMTAITPPSHDRDVDIAKDIQAFFNFKGYTCIIKSLDYKFYDMRRHISYSVMLSCENHLSVDVKEVVDDDWPA